jgi:hypothetical protein
MQITTAPDHFPAKWMNARSTLDEVRTHCSRSFEDGRYERFDFRRIWKVLKPSKSSTDQLLEAKNLAQI